MAASNFQQWNPTQANQESDTAYAADSQRSGGAPASSILPSATANKVLYQVTTFVAALAQALANKGYPMSDANLATLEGQLANIMTLADMNAYATVAALNAAVALLAPLNSPALTGAPSAPTPGAGDNSTRIATTAFLNAVLASYATQGWVSGNYMPVVNPVCTGTLNIAGAGGAVCLGPGPSDNSTRVPNTNWVWAAINSLFPSSHQGAGFLGQGGWQKLANGVIIQWGSGQFTGAANSAVNFAFPTSFPNWAGPVVGCNSNGGVTSDFPSFNFVPGNLSSFTGYCSADGTHGFYYIAIGN